MTSPSRILIHEAGSGEPIYIAEASSLLVMGPRYSAGRALLFERQLLPPTETPDAVMRQHLLSVQLRPPSVLYARGDGGRRANRLEPGDSWFKAAGSAGRYSWPDEADVFNIGLDPVFVERLAEREYGQDGVELVDHVGGADPVTRGLAEALEAEIVSGEPGGSLFIDSIATALGVHLLRHYAASPQRPAGRTYGLSRTALAAIDDHVRANLDAELRLEDLADLAHLSPFHFARSFKAATGLSPHQYVVQCRIERAQALLLRRDLTVAEVARRTGFATASHLARHFRRQTGLTPGAYRRTRGA